MAAATLATTEHVLGAVSSAVIPVAGLARPLRVVHITDSHVDLGPDPGSGSADLCEFLHGRYVGGFKANEQRGVPTIASEAFERQVALARMRGADLILHTGDLLNFPSPRAAQYAAGVLEARSAL